MQGDPFGVSFNPAGGAGGEQNGQRPSPIQQAIQTLSLKIPRVAGAGSIAPQALLDSPGGGALGGDPNAAQMLEMIKKLLFGRPGQVGTGPQMPRDPGQGGGDPGGLQPPGMTPPFLTPNFRPSDGVGNPGAQPTPYDNGASGRSQDPPGAPRPEQPMRAFLPGQARS